MSWAHCENVELVVTRVLFALTSVIVSVTSLREVGPGGG
jgi:hypothetical protein